MARPKSDVYARFLAKVMKMESGCHEWTSVINRGGYGKFHFEGRQDVAHRVAYRLFVGDPGKLAVLHKCDNRKCVNPDHLFVGTGADNVKDMDSKGRRGTKSKLTDANVAEIKRLISERYSQQEVAEQFGINQTTVSRIVLGKTTHFKE